MHQDQRIGLALGVLLLGAAGAFFFRNDSRPIAESPRLRSVKQLDARIAEKSITPYMQGIEDLDSTPGTVARAISDRGGPILSPGDDRSLPHLGSPDFLTDDSQDPFDHAAGQTRTQRHNVNEDDEVPDLAPIPLPESDEIFTSERGSPRDDVGSSQVEHVHVVQKGETLSSIAAKELGSTNKFIELFEANRDQLKNANDVQVGMKLRIPSRSIVRTTKPTHHQNQSDLLGDSAPPLLEPKNGRRDVGELPPIIIGSEGNSTNDARPVIPPTETKKFVAPKRLPLGTRVPGPQTDANDSKNQAGRRLSQLPPDDNDGKIAR